jgi:ferredoxin
MQASVECKQAPGMKAACTPDANACRACGLCVQACPEHAIKLARR